MEYEEPGHFYGYTKPYMRFFEEEENDTIRNTYRWAPDDQKSKVYERPVDVTLDADESQPVYEDVDQYRMYHALRLFHSLEGFCTGSLDLTGRHYHRYNELANTFVDLLKDYLELTKTVRSEEYQDKDWDGEVKTFVRYEMTDRELWRKFRLKWKTPRTLDYGLLRMWIERVSETMKNTEAKPKLQKLCLMHLPPELIDYIFSFASLDQARRLASTCKAMKSIGVPHLYHTRRVNFTFPHRNLIIQKLKELPASEEELDALFTEQSAELDSRVRFLVSRPDLINALQTLSICDEWRMEIAMFPSFRSLRRPSSLYVPVHHTFNTLLTSCLNLTSLSIGHCAITGGWLRTLPQLSKLHTLRLHSCWIEDEATENTIVHGHLPHSPQLSNLSWFERQYEGHEVRSRESDGRGLWYILLLFPNIITFNHTMLHAAGSLPSPLIRERATQLCSALRRIQLCLDSEFVPVLTDWFITTRLRTQAPCALTHLKLQTDYPLSDNVLVDLLHSIQSSPLEVLVFASIKEGSLTLIERIAQLFPDLLGLTLIRAETRRRRDSKSTPWPHQSGEYAFRLQGFRRLKYFGWNFRMEILEPTPSALLNFEASALKSEKGLWPYDESDIYFEDASNIALPFGCYCPTLEILGMEDGLCQHYVISRTPDGQVKATGVGGWFGVKGEVESQDWNPYDLGPDGWKCVLPEVEG
ncbi:hypothetical protein V5O48_009465 [Marasmius crinis-equi]|uniref:F-box domain-containing protein n=1 Tax=Marasmius crinis-equi TaxID=585013 RepID=A0ABR3FB62_9AGAR